MYKILLVDDEAASLSYLQQIINNKCNDYIITATANSGVEAIRKIENEMPDVIVSDVSMPEMDGLDLAAYIMEHELAISMIIVSGYSDFDYARKAIKSGVLDYLLKPVLPDELKQLLDRIKLTLDFRMYNKKNEIFRSVCVGRKVSNEDVQALLKNEEYYVTLTRFDGYPMDFERMNSKKVISEMSEPIFIFGRDEKEYLCVYPKETIVGSSIIETVKNRIIKEGIEGKYHTAIYTPRPISGSEVIACIPQMYQILKKSTIVGKSQVIDLRRYKILEINMSSDEKNIWKNINYAVSKKDREGVKKQLKNMFEIWEHHAIPLWYVDVKIKMLIFLLGQGELLKTNMDNAVTEGILDDLFINCSDMENLYNELVGLIFTSSKEITSGLKLDKEFVEIVCEYLGENVYESINIQDICNKFNVSQNYLGKLFRKYKGISVNTYFTSIRIETAKLLIDTVDGILIKDVAEQLGYSDQFYFSRVFRAYTGYSPTEYIERR